jgi:alcohol dehydrogenase class IV
MTVTRFSAPTRIVAGLGAIAGLKDELAALGHGPVAVVADRGVAEAGLLDRVLGVAGRRGVVVGLVDPDPRVEAAETAAAAAAEAGCGIVLMVGGGSALGVGKAVALRLRNPATVDTYEGRDRAPRAPVPSMAVPTTAGSGSEVSGALVLHDSRRDRLVVVRGHGYEPDVAVLDGELLVSLPHAPMLFAAFDALSHALESLWARGASATTDALALAAARQIRGTLARALDARDPIDLQRLLEASTMANLACGNAGLGLVHALSSATSVRLPHGLQNGVLLPYIAAFNRPVLSAEALAEVDALAGLYAELGFEARFDADALPPGAAEAMVTAALGNPFRDNNRRRAVGRQLHELVAQAGVPAGAARVARVGAIE